MGLAMKDQEMIDYAFTSPFNIRRQLAEGVTADGFWYEGSIHYNFFFVGGRFLSVPLQQDLRV